MPPSPCRWTPGYGKGWVGDRCSPAWETAWLFRGTPCWRVREVLWQRPLPAALGSVLTMTPAFPQILLLIDIEQSYINTNHEDFIGFAKYVLFKIAAGGVA